MNLRSPAMSSQTPTACSVSLNHRCQMLPCQPNELLMSSSHCLTVALASSCQYQISLLQCPGGSASTRPSLAATLGRAQKFAAGNIKWCLSSRWNWLGYLPVISWEAFSSVEGIIAVIFQCEIPYSRGQPSGLAEAYQRGSHLLLNSLLKLDACQPSLPQYLC